MRKLILFMLLCVTIPLFADAPEVLVGVDKGDTEGMYGVVVTSWGAITVGISTGSANKYIYTDWLVKNGSENSSDIMVSTCVAFRTPTTALEGNYYRVIPGESISPTGRIKHKPVFLRVVAGGSDCTVYLWKTKYTN